MEVADTILKFWFGHVEETIIPSEERAKIWFSEDPEIDNKIRTEFLSVHQELSEGGDQAWIQEPRSCLAAIIVLDQFTRHIFRHTADAFSQDNRALEICLAAMRREDDHFLSLIERVFFYFPLLHAEKLAYQEQAINAYEVLVDLAFDETKIIYESFLKFANHHYTIIQRFGRFPQRNALLGRESTEEELRYLADVKDEKDT